MDLHIENIKKIIFNDLELMRYFSFERVGKIKPKNILYYLTQLIKSPKESFITGVQNN